MPEDTGDNRNELGQFAPGQSGNPNGRPKGSGLNLTSLLKEKLEEIPVGQKEAYKVLFIKTLLNKALVEKDLQSLKLIMNYVDGLPMQNVDIKTGGERIAGFNFIKFEDEQDDNPDNTTDDQTASSVE